MELKIKQVVNNRDFITGQDPYGNMKRLELSEITLMKSSFLKNYFEMDQRNRVFRPENTRTPNLCVQNR